MSSEENMASTGENIENTAVNTIDSPSEEIPAEFSDVCYTQKMLLDVFKIKLF